MSLRLRRGLLIALLALLSGGLAWLASAVIGATEFDLGVGREGGAIRVTTDFPAASCSKTLSGDFPWVRFSCGSGGSEPVPDR